MIPVFRVKISVVVFIVITLVGCGGNLTSIDEVSVPTSFPTNTVESTTTSFTLPQIAYEYFEGITVVEIDKFDTLLGWESWKSEIAQLSNGVVKIVGQENWGGSFVSSNILQEGMGVLLE